MPAPGSHVPPVPSPVSVDTGRQPARAITATAEVATSSTGSLHDRLSSAHLFDAQRHIRPRPWRVRPWRTHPTMEEDRKTVKEIEKHEKNTRIQEDTHTHTHAHTHAQHSQLVPHTHTHTHTHIHRHTHTHMHT